MGGAGVYGTSQGAGEYRVLLELKLGPTLLASAAKDLLCDGSSAAFPVSLSPPPPSPLPLRHSPRGLVQVEFPRAVQIEPETFYTLSAVVEGPDLSYFGQEGQTEVAPSGGVDDAMEAGAGARGAADVPVPGLERVHERDGRPGRPAARDSILRILIFNICCPYL